MGHGHSHALRGGLEDEVRSGLEPERARRVRLVLAAVLLPFVLATIVGVAVLWPPAVGTAVAEELGTGDVAVVRAVVVDVEPITCAETLATDEPEECAEATVRLADGSETVIELPPAWVAVDVDAGTAVHVVISEMEGETTYAFASVDRTRVLGLLSGAFALLVVLVARVRGFAALIGLVIAFAIMRLFMLPALLAGSPAVPVAVLGSALIMFVALYVAHGVSMRTTTAVLGTMFGLATTAALGWAITNTAFLTGGGGDDELLLGAVATDVDLRGVLLAGLVLAGLGVLNDVTVTQASAVWELFEADPHRSTRRLFSSAMRIGRDHIASSVYTLVFAYAGAALPLLLLVVVYGDPVGRVVSSEEVAQELVSTLVGAIGLVLAVPMTTLTGALVLRAARGPRALAAPVAPVAPAAPPPPIPTTPAAPPARRPAAPPPGGPLTRRELRERDRASEG